MNRKCWHDRLDRRGFRLPAGPRRINNDSGSRFPFQIGLAIKSSRNEGRNALEKETTMSVRGNRREFLSDVGRGMLVATVGSVAAADMGLTSVWGSDEPERLRFG